MIEMKQFLACLTALIIIVPSCMNSQQMYAGKETLSCTVNGTRTNTSLYSCNGARSSCRAFLIFTARFPFNTVPTIGTLVSSNTRQMARINNVTEFTVFQTGRQVIVPVNCSCSGRHYQASTTFQTSAADERYDAVANDTFQGLTTCDSIQHANAGVEKDLLLAGKKLRIPLRCACPTTRQRQAAAGVKYLLTYSIYFGDTLYVLSNRFNVSVAALREANRFPDDHSTIYPFTTILIPMLNAPSSLSNAVIRGNEPAVSTASAPDGGKSGSRKALPAVVIAAGVVSPFLLIAFLVLCFFSKNRARERARARILERGRKGDLIGEIARVERTLRTFRFEEIKKATGNFGQSRRIKGNVYRGNLGKTVLAVKKVKGNSQNEVNTLFRINHFNIVKLHGFCEHKEDTYLIYEYMKTGTLREWLAGGRGSGEKKSWKTRIQIALDVANGLLYLHSFTKPAHIHNRVRSSSILLDGNLRAKIANFSLATRVDDDVTAGVIGLGCNGYMAPECVRSGSITPKVDVYAFGVVLLELLTGKKSVYVEDGCERLLSKEMAAVMEGANSGTGLAQLIVPGIFEDRGMEFAARVVAISLSCLTRDPEDRPNMVEVVSNLVKVQSS